MKEIIGKRIEKALVFHMIESITTYCDDDKVLDDGRFNVYQLSNSEFKRLCDIKSQEWKGDFGWWVAAKGSNLKSLDIEHFTVKGKTMRGYVSDKWDEILSDRQKDEPEVTHSLQQIRQCKYSDLLDYISEELGASQPRNICAIAMDLAKINNMTIGELFCKYQG